MFTYPDSVRFLYALGNEIKTAKLGLDRIRAVLAALGDPQRAYRVVHVAGTNGKGSTCAMIEAGLRAAGVRTGLFTSPHLIEPTERIRIDGVPVIPEQFQRAFDVVHNCAERLDLDCHPTYFETVTAMAFWLFRELDVETAVVETGLGGRLDATNVTELLLTVITPIDFDHEAYLGHTLDSIAGEKAGILKPGVPAVFARQRPEAAAVLAARAEELGVTVKHAEDFEIRDLQIDSRGSRFSGNRLSPGLRTSDRQCRHSGAQSPGAGHRNRRHRHNTMARPAGIRRSQSRRPARWRPQPRWSPGAGTLPGAFLPGPAHLDDLWRHAGQGCRRGCGYPVPLGIRTYLPRTRVLPRAAAGGAGGTRWARADGDEHRGGDGRSQAAR